MTALSTHPRHSSADNPNHDSRGPASVSSIFLRPIATPLPIGMIALAVGSLVLAGLQLSWITTAQGHMVALCLLAFVVPLQLVSFVFGYLSRDEGTASALGTLSGTWFAIGLVLLGSAPGSTSGALGLLLIAATGALLVPVAVSTASKPLIAAVFAVTALRFLLSGIYQLTGGTGWHTAAGVTGLVVVALAWYAAMAFALEAGRRKAVLPVFRRSGHAGPDPSSGDDPIGPVSHDAAVRSQL